MGTYSIRPIRLSDDQQVANLIRTVMPEFGAQGPGFAINDAEVDEMYRTYSRPQSAYFVVTDGERVVGGAGISPLEGGEQNTCELRKMYFLGEVRGLGLGRQMIDLCLDTARRLGFVRCYLETLNAMMQARALYEKNGFRPLPGPLGDTGHFSCDAFYIREL